MMQDMEAITPRKHSFDSDTIKCPNCISSSQKHQRLELQKSVDNSNSTIVLTSSETLRLESIKEQILTKLGLKSKPNVTKWLPKEVIKKTLSMAREDIASNVVQKDFPQTLVLSTTPYQQTDLEPDEFFGRTSEIIGFAEPGYMLNGQQLLEFPRPKEMDGTELKVKSAVLWVRIEFRSGFPHTLRPIYQKSDRNVTLWVFRVSAQSNATYVSGKEFDEQTEMSASLTVSLSSSLGWNKFDLTSTVQDWYSSGLQDRLRLLVDCSGCGDLIHPVLFQQTQKAEDSWRPFLVVYTDPTVTRRVKRRALDCSATTKGQCCKQKFYVSFKQLGWEDWIIAPSGYYANYCRGDCGVRRTPDMYYNHYSHVIEEYRKMDRLSGLQPCCAPVKFSPMSLIYFGPDSNIIKRDLPKMVVDECGCP
ncbi:inhibin beta chain-like [Diaphorina citri]|uniref:Inhibin beta chain-like n=1 Tax=Diaphorina citri TaxID=121845 RepID=A0A1S3D6N1_DIACI|nr:inhibin beta chain-like [Diaphorina citri]